MQLAETRQAATFEAGATGARAAGEPRAMPRRLDACAWHAGPPPTRLQRAVVRLAAAVMSVHAQPVAHLQGRWAGGGVGRCELERRKLLTSRSSWGTGSKEAGRRRRALAGGPRPHRVRVESAVQRWHVVGGSLAGDRPQAGQTLAQDPHAGLRQATGTGGGGRGAGWRRREAAVRSRHGHAEAMQSSRRPSSPSRPAPGAAGAAWSRAGRRPRRRGGPPAPPRTPHAVAERRRRPRARCA